MRLAYYAGASTAAAAACLLKAFHQRPNFYSATVYLSESNACLLILTNLLLVLGCNTMYALQRLLYGPLRPIEVEQLSEKAWYAVLDTLLAMPSFREDVGGWLLAMFCLLLAGKVWGWIGEGRVDVLEQQPPANPRLFHARLATSLVVSVMFAFGMLNYCVETVVADPRPGMMVIFAFEFAILSVFSTFTLMRYLLAVVQSRIEKAQMEKAIDERKIEIRAERAAARRNETADGTPAPASSPNEEPIEVDENEVEVPGWEEKRRFLFVLEVVTDFMKLMIYLAFFFVSITFNGLPMHILRDVYMTFASFSKRLADYVAYKKATSDMNSRYPDATTEEIRGDACIVCRENMLAWEQPNTQQQAAQPAGEQPAAAPPQSRRRDEGLRAKKLPCGHILHLRCLKAWLERQQVCPTCRRPVVVSADAAVAGQPAPPGGNGGVAGEAGQPRGQRRGRARIFNVGPVRIGFLNGPGDQIGNIVRQIQNPEGQQPQDAGQAANQQGPNHLGLQVPYLDGQGQQGAPRSTSASGARANAPVHEQLVQIERRLMQDAQNLGLEQAQLANLRMMEMENNRLRALQQSNQQPGGPASAAQRQAQVAPPQFPGMPMPAFMPLQPMLPFQQPFVPPPAEPLQGDNGQQLGNGHEHLPPGMTLPEGWTVMPLHRADPLSVPPVQVQPAGSHPGQGQSAQAQPAEAPAPAAERGMNANTMVNTTSSRPSDLSGANGAPDGPTNDNGSPLFVPTATASKTNGDVPPVAQISAPTHLDAATTAPSSSQVTSHQPESASQMRTSASAESSSQDDQPEQQQDNPWNSGQWSFDNTSKAPASSSEAISQPADGAGANNEQRDIDNKGKAKAVEVEDVPDADP